MTTSGNVTDVRWRQSAGGIPAADSELRVILTEEGEVLSVLGAPSPDLGADTNPVLSAEDAVRVVHDDSGTSGPVVRRSTAAGVTRGARFTDGTAAKLRRFAGRLAWNVVYRAAPDAVYDVMVDADTGKVLRRINLVKSDAPALVWERYPGAASGGTAQPVDLEALGYLPSSAANLTGPNVRAFSDLNDNDGSDAGEEITRSGVGFEFTFTPFMHSGAGCSAAKPCSWNRNMANSRTTNREQNGVQAFYLANRFHDHLAAAPISFSAADGSFEGVDKLILHTNDGATRRKPSTTPTCSRRRTGRRR